MRPSALATLGVLLILACKSLPVPEVDLVPIDALNPEEVRQRFSLSLPVAFRTISTVSFDYHRHSFTAIGYTDIDSARGTFTVVGLHPAGGFKLFELSGDADSVECAFALEEFSRRGDFVRAVAEDTRRIFFDRVPAPSATVFREKYHIRFLQQARVQDAALEYIFAGSDGVLVEKRYYEKGRKIWTVFYGRYQRNQGKLYPGDILLEHYLHHYRLTMRLREIRS